MKKLPFAVGIAAAILVGLFYLCKTTGMLRMYRCPSGANEPAIKTGSTIFASTFKKPERFDFIIFEKESQQQPGTQELIIYRLCGLPGDKVQLKNGVLFVNGNNADSRSNLYNHYMVTKPQDIKLVRALATVTEDANAPFLIAVDYGDSLVANLTTTYVKQNQMHCRLFTDNNPWAAEQLARIWAEPWTMDNFGPVTVPKDSLFLLGDNRHNAYDSRFTGFVARSSFKGTVLK